MTKGILIVGYGSRTGNLPSILETQAARLRARGRKNVYVGYFRIHTPAIPDAFNQMVADGIDDVLVVPYFIADAKLTDYLIPEKIGFTGKRGSVEVNGKKINVTECFAFNNSRVTTNILCDRIAEAGGNLETSGIMVVGHGSRDPTNNNSAVLALNADRLRRMGYKHVEYCFNEFDLPDVGETAEKLVKEGATELIVVPAFIANGVHLGEEIAEKMKIEFYSKGGEVEFAGKKIVVKYMRGVEDDPRLLEIIDSNVSEFLGE